MNEPNTAPVTPDPKRAIVHVHRGPWSRTVIAGVAGISGLTIIGAMLAIAGDVSPTTINVLLAIGGNIVTIVSVIAGRPGVPGASP